MRARIRRRLGAVLLLCLATGAQGTEQDAAPQSAPDEAPLSAIPWLSESLRSPDATDPDVTPLPPPPAIEIIALPEPNPDATGLRPARGSDLWAASDSATLVEALRRMPLPRLQAAHDLYAALLLAEAAPPRRNPGAGASAFLIARIDALLLMGALDPALALIERAGPERPELFRRWFDVGLLTGYEKRACATMAATPSLAPTAAARVFCLARAGRWETAVVTLEATAALGTLSAEDADRMARFLDPELFEGAPPMERPEVVTPLLFRVHEALGEPIATRDLPLAFAHADLRHVIGWKARIEAAERLARVGSVSANTLLGIYTARRPSASGGVWDRVQLMQDLDIALNSGRVEAVSRALLAAHAALAEAGLEQVLARMMAPRLARMQLEGPAGHVALRLRLISNTAAALSPTKLPPGTPADLAFAAALAAGEAARAEPPDPRSAIVRAAFLSPELDPADGELLAQGRTGEALLRGLRLLGEGVETAPRDVARALAIFRVTGRAETARHVALQYLLGATPP